jgi:hypothetical protein
MKTYVCGYCDDKGAPAMVRPRGVVVDYKDTPEDWTMNIVEERS